MWEGGGMEVTYFAPLKLDADNVKKNKIKKIKNKN